MLFPLFHSCILVHFIHGQICPCMDSPPKFIEELEKVKSDKEYISRFKNHGEKEWFKNYYHDEDIEYS
jgi:hypothetical protein